MTDLEHEIRLELKQGSLCSDRLPSKICFQHWAVWDDSAWQNRNCIFRTFFFVPERISNLSSRCGEIQMAYNWDIWSGYFNKKETNFRSWRRLEIIWLHVQVHKVWNVVLSWWWASVYTHVAESLWIWAIQSQKWWWYGPSGRSWSRIKSHWGHH